MQRRCGMLYHVRDVPGPIPPMYSTGVLYEMSDSKAWYAGILSGVGLVCTPSNTRIYVPAWMEWTRWSDFSFYTGFDYSRWMGLLGEFSFAGLFITCVGEFHWELTATLGLGLVLDVSGRCAPRLGITEYGSDVRFIGWQVSLERSVIFGDFMGKSWSDNNWNRWFCIVHVRSPGRFHILYFCQVGSIEY